MTNLVLSPVFFRELRAAARDKWTWRRRLICAAVALLGGVAIHGAQFGGLTAMATVKGLGMFQVLVWAIYCATFVAGTIFTADLLSGERRDGTMDLLLLTRLNPLELVLAKLLSASVETFSVLLGLMPFMFFPVMLGGVSLEAVVASVLVLMNSLFLSLVAGLVASALVQNGRAAMLISVFLCLVTALGGLGLAAGTHAASDWAWYSTVGLLLHAMGGTAFASLDSFLDYLLIQHLAGWFGILLAVLLVRAASQGTNLLNRVWEFLEARRVDAEKELRRGTRSREGLDEDPVAWLMTRERLSSAFLWAVIALLCAVVVPASFLFTKWWLEPATVAIACFVLHGSVKLWIALEATRRLAEDKRTGALQLMLATALTPKEVLRGLERGILRRFRKPMAVVLGIDLVFLALALREGSASAEIVVIVVQSMMIFFFDCFALVWMGLWDGASAANATRALIRTTLKILVLPWLLSVMLASVLAIGAGPGISSFYLLAASWFLVSYAANAGYYGISLNLLTRHVHELAAGVDASDAKPKTLAWLEEFHPPAQRAITPPPLPENPAAG